jgi:hypothetical protein
VTARPKYSGEFKQQAVDRALRSGLPAATIAREFGISPHTLRRWIRQHEPCTPRTAHVDGVVTEGRVWLGAPHTGDEVARPALPARGSPTRPTLVSATRTVASSFDRAARYLLPRVDRASDAVVRLPLRRRLLAVLLAWTWTVVLSGTVRPPPALHQGATAVHVLSLVVAFGAVLVIDWHGMLWLMERRRLREVTRLTDAAVPLIWLGLGGLLASGIFLKPDMTSPLTWTKLVLVLTVAVNGVLTAVTARILRELPGSATPAALHRDLQTKVIATIAVSQVAWWGAIAIGFTTAIARG